MTSEHIDPRVPLPGPPEPWVPSTMPKLRAGPPWAMTEMIAAEPFVAERVVARLAGDRSLADLVDTIRTAQDRGEPLTIVGCGTSEHAAEGIAAMWRAVGLDARHAQALEVVVEPSRSGLLVAVSHEGGTAATNEALRVARDGGSRTALVTAGDASPGAAIADAVVTTGEQDQSWCHTVGYLSPLVVGAAVVAQLSGSDLDGAWLSELLGGSTDEEGATRVAERLSGCDRLIVAGSGPDHASARELALKVAEGAHIPAQAFQLETVLHGHLAAAVTSTGFVLVLTDGTDFVLTRAMKVLTAAKSLGMPAAAIVSVEEDSKFASELTPAGRLVVPAASKIDQTTRSLLGATIPFQLIAERLATIRGINPDTLGRENPAQAAAHS